jgi:hypothetical protein
VDSVTGTAYEPIMEIKQHPDGFEVIGPFAPGDAPAFIAAGMKEPNVRCIEPSLEDAQALLELLRTEIQPWLEEEDRWLGLIVQGKAADSFAPLNWEGSRIKFLAIGRTPDTP